MSEELGRKRPIGTDETPVEEDVAKRSKLEESTPLIKANDEAPITTSSVCDDVVSNLAKSGDIPSSENNQEDPEIPGGDTVINKIGNDSEKGVKNGDNEIENGLLGKVSEKGENEAREKEKDQDSENGNLNGEAITSQIKQECEDKVAEKEVVEMVGCNGVDYSKTPKNEKGGLETPDVDYSKNSRDEKWEPEAPIKTENNSELDDSDTAKSNGSEKENKESTEDVIMLSDDEDGSRITKRKMSVMTHHFEIKKKIKALQNELRNEEATLVLLKKLRQSQTQSQEPQPNVSAPKPPSNHQPNHQPQVPQHMRQHSGPPPLVKGNQATPRALQNANQNIHMRHQQLNNHSRPQQHGPPPLVMTSRGGNNEVHSSQQQHHSSRNNIPQNMSRNNVSNRNQQQLQQQQQHRHQQQAVVKQAPPPPQDTQTPAQRQAAAKQALRKQLEKTLLQIPPPKPPPPEMNFIPSLACPDFILLLGLEEVVNHMIDYQLIARGQKSPDEKFVCTPFTCVQCNSDFTPVWKREKPGSKNVICEHCVTTNQKKALKQEHTNRLKSAFVKALQQEQEIERMQAVSTPTPSPQVTKSSTPQPQSIPSNPPMMQAASAAAAAANAAAAAAVANFRPTAEQLRQHHNFLQQAQLRGQPLGLPGFSHRAPFPYNIPFANQQELQRQYLLDMIPRGNMSWKQ